MLALTPSGTVSGTKVDLQEEKQVIPLPVGGAGPLVSSSLTAGKGRRVIPEVLTERPQDEFCRSPLQAPVTASQILGDQSPSSEEEEVEEGWGNRKQVGPQGTQEEVPEWEEDMETLVGSQGRFSGFQRSGVPGGRVVPQVPSDADVYVQVPKEVPSHGVSSQGTGGKSRVPRKRVPVEKFTYDFLGTPRKSKGTYRAASYAAVSLKEKQPETWAEALEGHDAPQWKEAFQKEFDSLVEKEVFEWAELPKGVRGISLKMIPTQKCDLTSVSGVKYKV